MRIMMLSQFYPPTIGGEEQHVRGLSRALSARGHSVSVVTLAQEGMPQHALDGVLRDREWKPRPFLMPIRVAISGKTQTPPLFPMLAALGKERSLSRLRDAIGLLTHTH